MEEHHPTKIVIPIVLGLVITDSLQLTFKPIFESGGSFSVALLARLFVFFVVTFRFYLGAIGYVNTEPKNIHLGLRSVNFIFAFASFCIFYMIALSVPHPEYFFLLIVILHAVDTVWFVVGLNGSKIFSLKAPEAGDIKPAATRDLMKFFLKLDLATLFIAFAIYKLLFQTDFTDAKATGAQWAFIIVLTLMSAIDFYRLSEFYFRFTDWSKGNLVPEDSVPPAAAAAPASAAPAP